jgi:hypothetical protein
VRDGLRAFVEEEVDAGVLEVAGVYLERGVGCVKGDRSARDDLGEGFRSRLELSVGRAVWGAPGPVVSVWAEAVPRFPRSRRRSRRGWQRGSP